VQQHLPALSHWFGIRPADIDAMTSSEVGVYLDALTQLNRERPPSG
jgi:hypothetical protein